MKTIFFFVLGFTLPVISQLSIVIAGGEESKELKISWLGTVSALFILCGYLIFYAK